MVGTPGQPSVQAATGRTTTSSLVIEDDDDEKNDDGWMNSLTDIETCPLRSSMPRVPRQH